MNQAITMLFFTLFLLPHAATSQDSSDRLERASVDSPLTYSLTPTKLALGQRATLEVRFSDPGRTAAGPHQPVVQDELLMNSSALKVMAKGYRYDGGHVWTYQLVSYQLGLVAIPPVEVIMGADNYSSQRLELRVVSTREESDHELRGDFGTILLPLRWGQWLFAILVGIAALGFSPWVAARVPKVKHAVPRPVLVPEEPPEDWLARELGVYRHRLRDGKEQAQWVDELTTILRHYFGKKLHRPVRSWTTREFHDNLDDNPVASRVGQILSLCDAFKFTGRHDSSAHKVASMALEKCEQVLDVEPSRT